jgi:predicted nucleotide-binding protein
VATIAEIIEGIDKLRKDLVEVRNSTLSGDSLRDAKLETWTKRAYEQLKGWGFLAEAEKDLGRNSMTRMYDGVDIKAKVRDDGLRALRDDLASHPQYYESRLASAEQFETTSSKRAPTKIYKVFLGHGRSMLWAKVHMFLKDELHLNVEAWETDARAGLHSIEVLKQALRSSIFAVIVVTGEDATADGGLRARQNVVHEIGLFQGSLGFQKVALLQQDGVEEFSNLAGLQVIPFSGERIDSSFYGLQRMLRREEIIK